VRESHPAEPFAVAEHAEDGVHVIAATGELDLATAPLLCARLDKRRHSRLLVDLTDVEFCDSTGLRAVLGAAPEVRANGGRFALACSRAGAVARLLEVVGAREWLVVHDDAATAIAALRR
jgi:anti-sigma B factor antagonist